MVKTQVELPTKKIEAFFQRGKITEFALFDSVLPEDCRPDSNIDFLVTFAPDTHWSLLDSVRM